MINTVGPVSSLHSPRSCNTIIKKWSIIILHTCYTAQAEGKRKRAGQWACKLAWALRLNLQQRQNPATQHNPPPRTKTDSEALIPPDMRTRVMWQLPAAMAPPTASSPATGILCSHAPPYTHHTSTTFCSSTHTTLQVGAQKGFAQVHTSLRRLRYPPAVFKYRHSRMQQSQVQLLRLVDAPCLHGSVFNPFTTPLHCTCCSQLWTHTNRQRCWCRAAMCAPQRMCVRLHGTHMCSAYTHSATPLNRQGCSHPHPSTPDVLSL